MNVGQSGNVMAVVNGQKLECLDEEEVSLRVDNTNGVCIVGVSDITPCQFPADLIFIMKEEKAKGEESHRAFEFSLAAHNGFTLWLRYPHGVLHNYIESFIDSVTNCPAPKMPDDGSLDIEALSKKEHERIGGVDWRVCFINDDFQVCPTYPRHFMVPQSISDSVVRHAARFRARSRLPILSYRHPTGSALVRSSQALVGIQKARSVQDERLVSAIRDLSPSNLLLIVDARPARSAMANTISGAGSMPLENYSGCSRVHLGIENIHAVRDSYLAMIKLRLGGASERSAMIDSGWMMHFARIMEGVRIICQHLQNGMSVLVHCSDGWDRTAQLVSLVQLCLDPQVRTLEGFSLLVQREWVAAGHQFEKRLGRLLPMNALLGSRSAAPARAISSMFNSSGEGGNNQQLRDEFCPIFPQFIDCLRQLLRVYPREFEFNSVLLDELLVEVYGCRTITFQGNNDRERSNLTGGLNFWTGILGPQQRTNFINPVYKATDAVLMIDDDVLFHA